MGFFWWTIDELKFDAAFFGTLRQTGAILSIAVLWLFSKQLTETSVPKTLLWIAIAQMILSLPNIGLIYGLHHWTATTFGFGARTIAFIDFSCGLAVCAAQHGTAARAHCVLRPAGPSRDVVCVDGVVDEFGNRGVAIADQVPQ